MNTTISFSIILLCIINGLTDSIVCYNYNSIPLFTISPKIITYQNSSNSNPYVYLQYKYQNPYINININNYYVLLVSILSNVYIHRPLLYDSQFNSLYFIFPYDSFNCTSLLSIYLSINNGSNYSNQYAQLQLINMNEITYSLVNGINSLRSSGGNSIQISIIHNNSTQFDLDNNNLYNDSNKLFNILFSTSNNLQYALSSSQSVYSTAQLLSIPTYNTLSILTPETFMKWNCSNLTLLYLYISYNDIDYHQIPISFQLISSKRYQIAFSYNGVITDFGWTYSHNLGKIAINDLFGLSVQTTYHENITDLIQIESILNSNQYDMFLMCTSGYYISIMQLSHKYPNIQFVTIADPYEVYQSTGTDQPQLTNNFNVVWGYQYLARYLAGIVAGGVAARYNLNDIGYVGAFKNSGVLLGLNAFTLGVQLINPTAIIHYKYINNWYNPYAERECAKSFINEKIQLLAHHTDSHEPMTIISNNQGFGIGSNSPISRIIIGERILTAPIYNWGNLYIPIVKKALNNELMGYASIGGINEGAIDISSLSQYVSLDIIETLQFAKKSLIDHANRNNNLYNESAIFCSSNNKPIYDNANNLIIPINTCMNSLEMSRVNWFISGVIDEGLYIPNLPAIDENYISTKAKSSIYFVTSLLILIIVLVIFFIVFNRDQLIIRIFNYKFLSTTLLGSLITLSCVYLLGLDGSTMNKSQLDSVCILLPFWLNIGFILIFCPLFAKLWRFRKLYNNNRITPLIHINDQLLFGLIFLFFIPSLIILTIWSIMDPLQWNRIIINKDSDNFPIEAKSSCSSQNANTYVALLFTYALILLVIGNIIAYLCRNINIEYNQSKWIGLSVINLLQLLVILVPLNYSIPNQSTSLFLLRSLSLIICNTVVLGFLLVPSVIAMKSNDSVEVYTNSIINNNNNDQSIGISANSNNNNRKIHQNHNNMNAVNNDIPRSNDNNHALFVPVPASNHLTLH